MKQIEQRAAPSRQPPARGPVWDGPDTKQVSCENGSVQLEVHCEEGLSVEQQLARLSLAPVGRNALVATAYADQSMKGGSNMVAAMEVVAEMCGKVRTGSLDDITDILTAQTLTLDTIFAEMSRRALLNVGKSPQVAERYLGLAMKAQANARTTAETLARMKRGGKQHIQITHVHEGGQAVVADTVHTGGGRRKKVKSVEQVHERCAELAALPRQDESGDAMSVARGAGEAEVPAARRQSDRGA